MNVSDIATLVLFADDTNILMHRESLDTLVNIAANNELSKLSVRFITNLLSMNVKKTKFVLFRSTIKYN